MNIQSISIVPESIGCNAQCKYCIAAMTPPTQKGAKLNLSRLKDALMYAKAGGAQSAIITSKGETLISQWPFISQILNICSENGFGHRDLHTNAYFIQERMDEFYSSFIDIKGRLTNITITVASLDESINKEIMGISYNFNKVFKFLSKDCDLVIRLSCVMNKEGVHDKNSMIKYIEKAKSIGIRAIVFRELWIPKSNNNTSKSDKISKWSRSNQVNINKGVQAIKSLQEEGKAKPIFTLPWGQIVYDIKGINVACSTCTENFWEADKGAIKSVVFLPDNHLYSSWEFKGSIIL